MFRARALSWESDLENGKFARVARVKRKEGNIVGHDLKIITANGVE